MSCQPALLTDNPTTQPGRKRTLKRNGKGRPSRSVIAGRLTWLRCLVGAGRMADAAEFHRKHGLHRYGATVPPVPPAEPATALPAPPATATAPTGDPAYGATATGPAPGFASHGGEGVDQPHGRDNWDKTNQNGQNLQYGCTTTPAVQILQCSPVATAGVVPLAVEADLTRLAAKAVYTPTVTPPAGESEGDRGFGQAESRSGADLGENVVSVWPKLAEGVVGKVCRNKQYNELRVVGEDGREMWTKVGNWLFAGGLVRGERVLVRKVWGSGDDTDAEYEVVRRMDVNEEVPQVPTVVEPPLVEPSAVSELETPVAILPQFQREEPDYPRKQESADDYIARIRAEAAKWANGQGR